MPSMNQTPTETPLPLQQLVCSVCGHPLEKIDWDHVECCPRNCRNSHSITEGEFERAMKLLWNSTLPSCSMLRVS